MKKISNLFVMSLMAAGLVACSNDEATIGENGELGGDNLYMKVKLEMPATRAMGNPDQEVGNANENAVNDIHLVLVNDATGEVIASSTSGMTNIVGPDLKDGLYVTSFKSEKLLAAATKKVKVIVYCNGKPVEPFGPQNQTTLASTENKADEEQAIWGGAGNANGFLMTNAKQAEMTTTLPSKDVLYACNTAEKAWPLSTISVERAVARFDVAKTNDLAVTEKVDNKGIQFHINDIALFNIPEKTYDIRHESQDGKISSNVWDDVAATSTYVIDAHQEGQQTGERPVAVDGLLDQGIQESDLTWTSFDKLTTPDNWDGKPEGATSEYGAKDYFFWRYATENTFAKGATIYKQDATGVGYRGEIKAATEASADVKAAMKAGRAIYVFNDILYGDWDRVKRAATGGKIESDVADDRLFPANNALKSAYDQVVAAAERLGGQTEGNIAEAAKDSKKFKVFTAKNTEGANHYYMYYQYFNKHNEDGDDNAYGAMEYGVVRNNVYKLDVTKIMKFGEPEWIRPWGPIIPKEAYFEVSVTILPWTVRVNDIIL